ncbi:MAG: ligT like phosphoesterase [bacterium]|nr:ligT like phosphoesterase [bacterium]
MEKYSDFLQRISYQRAELDIGWGAFTPDARLSEKVAPDNSFRAFYGDTVVFDLDDTVKKQVNAIVDSLYKAVPQCFAEKLDKRTLHMTLHDLSASRDLGKISQDVFMNEIKLALALGRRPIKIRTIKMAANYIVNMVNTSLVLALVPADEKEWNKLQFLYDLINKVRLCPYPYLTPHITLAYYRAAGFSAEAALALKDKVRELNRSSFSIVLRTSDLYYQKFTDMNSYISIFPLAKISKS